jgi:hypothetical protein
LVQPQSSAVISARSSTESILMALLMDSTVLTTRICPKDGLFATEICVSPVGRPFCVCQKSFAQAHCPGGNVRVSLC